MWGYRPSITVPTNQITDPVERCCDGTSPLFLTCQGRETSAPEPYLSKVLGDNRNVIMCETHRANSQRDADESTIKHNDIKFPRYKK